MFGNKNAKTKRLSDEIKYIRQRGEVNQRELARAFAVSEDAIADDLAALHAKGELLCQKGQRISLLEHWFGRRR